MSDFHAIARDLAVLLQTRPMTSGSHTERADWLEGKARLLDRLAAQVSAPTRHEVHELAGRARLQARRFRICARLDPRGGARR